MQSKRLVPNIFAAVGCVILFTLLFTDSLYANIIAGVGLLMLFLAWLTANLYRLPTDTNEKNQKIKVFIAMSLCVAVGFSMLTYYELQMPKYSIAKINKQLYTVPPQLSKRQLLKLGRECNTFGNTLCSHDVFAKIARMDPRDFKALANLAMAQSLLGFHDFAVQNFKRAIDQGVDTYDVYKFYGHSLRNIGQIKEASQAYNKSLKLNPKQKQLANRVKKMKATGLQPSSAQEL